MIKFATLGPGGTNHELVTQRYIDFHQLKVIYLHQHVAIHYQSNV